MPKTLKVFVYIVIAIVALAIVAGFFVVGSPKEERLRRFDDQRVSNLQYIQSEVLNYWINKRTLPADLSLVRDDLRGVMIPNDPETGSEYTYVVKGPLTFSLCATFNLPNEGAPGIPKTAPRAPEYYGGGLGENWQHGAGSTCFDRTIDEDFYRPIPSIQK